MHDGDVVVLNFSLAHIRSQLYVLKIGQQIISWTGFRSLNHSVRFCPKRQKHVWVLTSLLSCALYGRENFCIGQCLWFSAQG